MDSDGPATSREPHRLRLHHDRFPGEPILDTAISHAMLRRVAAGSVGDSLRLYVPENALLFSSLDARRPGYARALALAERSGFPSLIRLAGGQAAAFLDQSIAFAWASSDPDARLHIRRRFEDISGWIAASLRRLGLDARVGPLSGEYCPGEYSVNIGGRIKVMGVGQRVIRGGAHIGGVLTVAQTELLRDTLAPIYEALELEFQAETVGGIADVDPSLGPAEIIRAMGEVLEESGYLLEASRFDASIRHEAETLIPIHTPELRSGLGELLRTGPRDGETLVQDEKTASTHEPTGNDDS